MIPAHKRFQPHDLEAADGHPRLVMKKEFLIVDGVTQAGFKFKTLRSLSVHIGRIEPIFVSARLFGPIKRSTGVLDQTGSVVPVLGEKADAHAGCSKEFLPI